MPCIFIQSTSVDVVSVKPAAGAEPVGHAPTCEVEAGATGINATAAVALDEASTGTRAAIKATAETTPTRRLILENILSPFV